MPERIRLSRRKGWRLPPGVVNVARPTKWGNPFVVGERIYREQEDLAPYVPIPGGWGGLTSITILHPETAVAAYMDWLVNNPALFIAAFEELPGKDLACWCPIDRPCHGTALLEMVNEP